MDSIKCSACDKEFSSSDQVVNADCGCLVHVFKLNCNDDDFCHNCNRKFHVFSNAPLVDIKKTKSPKKNDNNSQKLIDETLKEMEGKFNKQVEIQKKAFDDYVVETNKKFQEQRKINLEMMKKLNLLSKSQEDLMKMFHEQTIESKKIIETLTRIITQELAGMKRDIQSLQDDLENIYDSYVISEHCEECDEHTE